MENFSEAAERNKVVIADALGSLLPSAGVVLEVGSGAGQHALLFSERFPALEWQPSEHPGTFPALARNLGSALPAERTNVLPALELDAGADHWPLPTAPSVIFSANTLHIMDAATGLRFIRTAAGVLVPGGRLIVYGPFRYNGAFTTESNAAFDGWLKGRGAHQGIRDFEAIDDVARAGGLQLLEDRPMPANNQLLCWEKGVA